jgi:hypothetical protein
MKKIISLLASLVLFVASYAQTSLKIGKETINTYGPKISTFKLVNIKNIPTGRVDTYMGEVADMVYITVCYYDNNTISMIRQSVIPLVEVLGNTFKCTVAKNVDPYQLSSPKVTYTISLGFVKTGTSTWVNELGTTTTYESSIAAQAYNGTDHLIPFATAKQANDAKVKLAKIFKPHQ